MQLLVHQNNIKFAIQVFNPHFPIQNSNLFVALKIEPDPTSTTTFSVLTKCRVLNLHAYFERLTTISHLFALHLFLSSPILCCTSFFFISSIHSNLVHPNVASHFERFQISSYLRFIGSFFASLPRLQIYWFTAQQLYVYSLLL